MKRKFRWKRLVGILLIIISVSVFAVTYASCYRSVQYNPNTRTYVACRTDGKINSTSFVGISELSHLYHDNQIYGAYAIEPDGVFEVSFRVYGNMFIVTDKEGEDVIEYCN